ncbi:hypothetical protein [Streptomyces sp. CC224B]|uniref:DUF6895 family protein n=1 Tax=Streptomyces sp. CC224B TaxID=3044571 RepID=UPI0024A93DD1|nr:hypothetical protein [Streptomyces sp. CC224B]
MSNAFARTAHDIGSRALTWLHTHRAHGALSPSVRAELGRDADAYKTVGELTLAASLVLRGGVAGTTELALARDLLEHCWHQLGDGSLLYERLLRHPLTTDAIETYAHFARSGYRFPELERLIAHTVALRSTHAVEHVPNRRLAVANAARVIGLDAGPGAYDWDGLTRATWLGATPEPWHIDWLTGYSVTHTAFHLTDWGRLPGGLPADIATYLTHWLPVWTDIWAEAGHWDLMAELMIVGACLPEPWTEAADWQRLAAVQHEDGLVPRDAQPVDDEDDDDPARRFDAHYHPTVVAAVAATTALTRALDAPRQPGS